MAVATTQDAEAGEALLAKGSAGARPDTPCPACAGRRPRPSSVFRSRGLWLTYLNLVLFLTSVMLLVAGGARRRGESPSARDALQATSSWSPIFDAVDLTPRTVTVDGRLHVPPDSSPFRGEPSNDTDAAWDDVAAEAFEVILVNASTLARAGYDPAHYFKAPDSWPGGSDEGSGAGAGAGADGEDRFPVQIDVFHQIHCLNAVRKQMYYQHYHAGEFPDGPSEMHWMHQRHCLHMVLQSLMCNANVDIVPHRWVERDSKPFAQFSIRRQCRDFDALRRWNRRHAIRNVRELWPRDKTAMPPDAFVWPGYGETSPEEGG